MTNEIINMLLAAQKEEKARKEKIKKYEEIDKELERIVNEDTEKYIKYVWKYLKEEYFTLPQSSPTIEAYGGFIRQNDYEEDNKFYSRIIDYNNRHDEKIYVLDDEENENYYIFLEELCNKLKEDGIIINVNKCINVIKFSCPRNHMRDLIENADKLTSEESAVKTLQRIRKKD